MPKDHSLAYQQLSAGEQQLVNLDIALNLAKFHSQLRPTILILEQSAFPTLDKDNLEKLLKTLCDKSWPFQTIVTFHKFNQELAPQNTSVWQLRLVGGEIEARKLCHN
jgi:DNA repair exonuclease SbcCD ATPase subunit